MEEGGICVLEVLVPLSSPTTPTCPDRFGYRLVTKPSVDHAEEHQYVTHEGPCGLCSSLQDLSVYMETPDLATIGIQCSIRALVDFYDGVT